MEALAMSKKERRRLELFKRVRNGEVTLVKASELLGLSYRQAKRSYARYRCEGDAGVVHGLRGRVSNRGVDPGKKARVLKLYREKYADFGPTLECEYLAKDDQLNVGAEPLRQWLIASGTASLSASCSGHSKWQTPTVRHRTNTGRGVHMRSFYCIGNTVESGLLIDRLFFPSRC